MEIGKTVGGGVWDEEGEEGTRRVEEEDGEREREDVDLRLEEGLCFFFFSFGSFFCFGLVLRVLEG